MRISALPLILALSLAACAEDGYDCRCSAITFYPVNPDATTPSGASVDSSKIDIDLAKIDFLTVELEACLWMSIDRRAFDIKVATDWAVTLGGNQYFPCEIPGGKCAGALQPSNHVIVTPNLAAYKHELIHLATGVRDHADPAFDCE